MRSEEFAEGRSLAFGVRKAFARRLRGVRGVRSKGGHSEAFEGGRLKAFGSVQWRSTTVGLPAMSDGLGWPWDDPLGRYGCAAFLFKTTRTQ